MKHYALLLITILPYHHILPETHISLVDYMVDQELEEILDDYVDEIYEKLKKIHHGSRNHGVWKFEWLPGYYIKYGLARIKGMEKMKKCLEQHNLNLLTVPDKKIYHLKDKPEDLSDLNYTVIIKAVDRSPNPAPLTLKQVKQLCTIIHETKYISMTSTNFIRGTDDLLHLIDTEATFSSEEILRGFLRMITTRPNLNKQYTKEALKHIFHEIKACLDRRSQWEQAEVLEKINAALRRQERPYSWDYRGYFNELFVSS